MVLDPVPWFPLSHNFPRVNGRRFNCLYVRKIKTEEMYGRTVGIHPVGFPYLGITVRPGTRTPGRNAMNTLPNIEHVYKSGLCVEFA